MKGAGGRQLDWSAARAVPILTAARRLNAQLSAKRLQRCPFVDHRDGNPSFSLDTGKNLFNCFGCGRGGSVIEFVAAYRGVEKIDACRWLLRLPERDVPPRLPSNRAPIKPQRPSKITDAEIYAAFLSQSPLEKSGAAYLARRCISIRTAATFGVGQVGDPKKTLNHLLEQFGVSRIRRSGLTNQADYLCFPPQALIFAHFSKGVPLFLQSRRIDPGTPRWMGLNGIGKIPFNLDAIESASEIYLVEGAIDVLSAHELGRVALGLPGAFTSLSSELCKRLSDKTIYLLPDDDEAGAQMAERTRNVLLNHGVQVHIQKLSTGSDLNEYLIAHRSKDA
ncbi:toprim domain-containing protein [Qipengyuania sp. 1XM1-15A]|uniref:toprim domain-containing protein n=1 Tax=Qipengyuania xiamenensis TaxID=2867237 RepID=UPI001C869DD9|nr:toprim domain-containing protein [Qipengyuania xiamenensis]MBX7532640.1 toprim domain-containing protein [Qipengyuania xiamenensis]